MISRVEIKGSALVIWALLYFLDSNGILAWVLGACILHELGHWVTIRALGGRISRLKLTCSGAELRLSGAGSLSHGQMILAALAGPAVNLMLAALAVEAARCGMGTKLYLFAGVNLGLAAFNLIPAEGLDGGSVLREIAAWRGREHLGEHMIRIFSVLTAVMLLGTGGILLFESGGRNFTLFLAGGWMLLQVWEKHHDAAV